MRRVVITGLGIVSCLGNDKRSVSESLRELRSGITFQPEYATMGFRSHVAGAPVIDLDAAIDRKVRRFMGPAAAYAYVAMKDAIADSGLTPDMVSNPRTGLITGSGGGSPENQVEAADIARTKGIKRIGAFMVPRTMTSTTSACLATPFGIKGINFSIGSACATSAHCIGESAEKIALGKQDVMFAGGGEELHWSLSCLFDAMGALSSRRNATPTEASRAYDADRDGFVIAGGGGMVVLEEYEHARKRGARIYAEVVGLWRDLRRLRHGRALRRRCRALHADGARDRARSGRLPQHPRHLDSRGRRGRTGRDPRDLRCRRSGRAPPFSSTKSLSGHSLGAAGVQEAIYCLLMMAGGFIAGSANVTTPDPAVGDLPLVTETRDARLTTVMSNSFGFGGTNATLVLRKV